MASLSSDIVDFAHNSIATALASVIEQSQKAEFDIAPCMHAISLLESLPPADIVDDRVELALAVTRCLGAERAVLGIRALTAAKPKDARICDPHTRRKWLNFSGVLHIGLGNPSIATAHLAAALELATELRDAPGICGIWSNLSLLASGSGQYADAVRYTTLAISAMEDHDQVSNAALAEMLVPPYMNRAEALHHLGRLDDSLSDASSAFTYSLCSAGYASHIMVLTQKVNALCLLARLRVQRGELVQASVVIDAAETLLRDPKASDVQRLGIQCARGELLAARGCIHEATELLEQTLSEALQLDPSSVGNDSVMESMHALQRLCKATDQPLKAEMYLSKIGQRLRQNANSAMAALSNLSHFTMNSDIAAAMQNVDEYLRGVSGETPRADNIGGSLQHLVSIAASASATEELSGEHGVRVACLCSHVARAMGLTEAAVREAEHAGLIHDLGKVGVPQSVLTKSDGLSEHERGLLDGHAECGAQLIERSALPNRTRLAQLVRLHHVPFNSVPETHARAIPIEARILSACDRLDALITGRPRRPAVDLNAALRELLEISGRELDPRVVEVLIETIREIQRQHASVLDFLAAGAEEFDYTSARRRLRRAATNETPIA